MRSLIGWLVAALVLMAAGSPAHAAWHEAKSKHFIIYADMKPDHLRRYSERLERFDKAVRHLRSMDDPPLTDSQRLIIYVLSDQEAVAKLVGGSMVAGFYAARSSGAMAFVPRRAGSSFDDWDLDSETIFFHEYAHHLHLQNTSAALPGWVTEGFAEFFSTAKVNKDGSVLIGSPAQHRAHGLFNYSGLPLEDMLGGTYTKLDARAWELLYGRGWLLTHYLIFADERRGQLGRYIEAIQKGTPALESAKAAFGDLRQLDRDLDRYLGKRLTGFLIDAKALAIGPIQVRQMTDGESAIMKARIRSKRGVSSKTAPAVAADARKAAAAYPNDPFVQATLAEAEHDAGNYAAAEAPADRALAADPNYLHALIYKGRIRMELARADPEKADWKDVRSWFTRANKVDTEAAEPLMLFYRSYLEAGAQPTRNAVDALLYAVALAPQDEGLRLNAVYQLLRDGRVPEAKTMFAPIAFAPHAGEQWRERTGKVMAAMIANDGKKALAELEALQSPPEDEVASN